MDPIALHAGEQPALVLEDGRTLSHRELVRLVDRVGLLLPAERKCLVALLGDREMGTVLGYLAGLRCGHAVAWFGAAADRGRRASLVNRYAPEVVIGPEPDIAAVVADDFPGAYRRLDAGIGVGADRIRIAVAHDVTAHPEVAPGTSLVLLTSGSESGGRAVRLSAKSIAANCRGVQEALRIDTRSRAATSLPLFYTYGLSVLNSHLSAGATVLLTAAPATGIGFWNLFAAAGCDTFAGVPAHFDWFARSRLPWDDVASLRSMTVSGGRLRAALARRFHARCSETARRFYKMYGQTEATARITVLQPEDFAAHGDSVGRVLTGGRVTIEHTQGEDGMGRIVYRGPCAMQGYASGRADLALADEMRGTVDTGDLGVLREGFLYLAGRAGRFVKPGGIRVSLDAVEEAFAAVTPAAAVGTVDERAHVFVEPAPTAEIEAVRRGLLSELRLAPRAVRVHVIPNLPVRGSGKPDYRLLRSRATMTEKCWTEGR
ncbi:AMP-binding protein [Phytoactinopolyspora halotolerans]|uniref:AMP-binding protein n=1 Tax=Phytoactinopolyspora halotolerans TaxID=1981512 RepID=A0A6L9S365_9ACTN|nr:AMP-binding protein [Phytoactinopolyspora halotolerans]NED99844.1 AMP-binding protein [Phytoactinopolyspora halotolerans]